MTSVVFARVGPPSRQIRQLARTLELAGIPVGWRVEQLSSLVRRRYTSRFIGTAMVYVSTILLSFRLRKATASIPGKKVVVVTQPLTALAFWRSSIPVAYWYVGSEIDWWQAQSPVDKGFSIFYRIIEFLGARSSTWVFSLSKRMAGLLEAITRVPVHDIPYGVDTDLFSPVKRTSASATMTILFVGVVKEVKGVDLLVDACCTLVPEFPLRLQVIGEIPPAWRRFAEALKKEAISRGLDLEFPGFVGWDRLCEIMANATVLVLPSRREAQGNVNLEAMASGVPIVCSRVGGMPELIEENQCGLVFEANDADSLARQLRILLGNPGLRSKLGANGRKAAVERYSWEAVARDLVKSIGV